MVKLDGYVALLETLANNGNANPAQMISLSGIGQKELKPALVFLQDQGCLLVEPSNGKAFPRYSITQRGLRILKFFNFQSST
jgi:hypothetical protein